MSSATLRVYRREQTPLQRAHLNVVCALREVEDDLSDRELDSVAQVVACRVRLVKQARAASSRVEHLDSPTFREVAAA